MEEQIEQTELIAENTAVEKTEEIAEIPQEKEVISESAKKEIIQKYLAELLVSKPKVSLLDQGIMAKTPIKKPKTILEAGTLAKEIFTKINN